jgi:hypothetical protein
VAAVSVAAAIRAMLAAGLTIEHALLAAEAFEAEATETTEPSKGTARQERNRRYYEKRASEKRLKASQSDVSSDVSDALRRFSDDQDAAPPPPSPKEIPPAPPKEITPSLRPKVGPNGPTKGSASAYDEHLAALMTVLDAAHAAFVVHHRRGFRGKPFTPRAAELLALKFGRCPDPNGAADAMIANGWQGFEPEWMDSRRTTNNVVALARPEMAKKDTVANAATRRMEQLKNERLARAEADPDKSPHGGVPGYGERSLG